MQVPSIQDQAAAVNLEEQTSTWPPRTPSSGEHKFSVSVETHNTTHSSSHTSPSCRQQCLSSQKRAMGVTGSIWEHNSVLQPHHFLGVTLGSNVTSLSKPNCPKIKVKGAEENPYPDKKLPTGTRLSFSQDQVLIPDMRRRHSPCWVCVLISTYPVILSIPGCTADHQVFLMGLGHLLPSVNRSCL